MGMGIKATNVKKILQILYRIIMDLALHFPDIDGTISNEILGIVAAPKSRAEFISALRIGPTVPGT